MTDDEKRGPLADQLAQARQDAAERATHCEPPAVCAVGEITTEAPATPAPQVTRRAPKWLREVRCGGIVVLTNVQHDPPPPAPAGWEVDRRTAWKVYRRGGGRVV